jgi:oxidase EvaA
MTLGQLRALVGRDGTIHMDTRSVVGCLPLGDEGGAERLTKSAARKPYEESIVRSACLRSGVEGSKAWLNGVALSKRIDREVLDLNELEGWILDDAMLRPTRKCPRDFSIIAVEVEANRREVSRWTQPLILPGESGALGLLCQRAGDVLRFLVQAGVEPGFGTVAQLFPTLMHGSAPDSVADHFRHARRETVRLEARNSEEGGRFFLNEIGYKIIEAHPDTPVDFPESHRWLTLGDLAELGRAGHVSIELRNLLAGLPATSSE